MRKQRAERLRFAVNSLPPETQRAMLEGIRENRIVTGANTDRRGGLCPMLAADRDAFAVTPLAEIFATAWDQYTGTSFVNVTRRTACDRDLAVLRSMLETSLEMHGSAATDLTAAASEIRAELEAPANPLESPEIAQAREVFTVAARLEVARALEATGYAPHQPALPSRPPVPAAPAHLRARTPADPAPPARLVEPAWAPATRARTSARSAPARVAAPAHRPASNRTASELDRERARAIVANQASTLRPRAWPRPTGAPVAEPIAATPVAVPAPAVAQLGGDQPRTPELVTTGSGWAWLRPLRSYDEYERQLQDLGEMRRTPGSDDARSDGGGHRSSDAKQPEPSRA